ncbi:MAG: hypothetical protein LBC63_05945 [Holophagales bacterium]|jgi:hypothetical protein|nr:hypothetical protein [Holophagales bacterium]
MKIQFIIAILAAQASLFAQGYSRPLDLRFQVGAEMTRPYESLFFRDKAMGFDYISQADFQTGPLIRMLGEFPVGKGFYYELGGRPETDSRLDFNTTIENTDIDTHDVKVYYSYFSFGVGAMYNWNFGLSIGAHLEGRVERIVSTGPLYENNDLLNPMPLDGSVSYTRPWGRVNMDFTFNNHGRVRPFIGVEGAYPVLTREQRHYWSRGVRQENRFMESIAPRGSIAAYLGFRFAIPSGP